MRTPVNFTGIWKEISVSSLYSSELRMSGTTYLRKALCYQVLGFQTYQDINVVKFPVCKVLCTFMATKVSCFTKYIKQQ